MATTEDHLPVPADAVVYPVELRQPEGFDPEDLATWPDVVGSLELVEERLLYVPPGGERQALTTIDAAFVLATWSRANPDFIVCGADIGIQFGRDIRGADAAVWRRADLGELSDGVIKRPPILAVEIAGRFQTEADLRRKAAWYLARGVQIVWILLPKEREVVVVTSVGETRYRRDETISEHAELPGLRAEVNELFSQLGR